MTAAPATLARAEWTGTQDAPLHIAMVAPLCGAGAGDVADRVNCLVDALVDRGHRVTLIAAGRHHTNAQQFLATDAGGLYGPNAFGAPTPLDVPGGLTPDLLHAACAARLVETTGANVVHDHTLVGPLAARGRLMPTVVSVYGSVHGDTVDYYRALCDTVGLVATSDAQRSSAPDLPWLATVDDMAPEAAAAAYESVYRTVLGSIHEPDVGLLSDWPDDLSWWDGEDPLQEAS